jgi:exportin-T
MNATLQQFEQAVLCGFDMANISSETDPTSAGIREQATQYCEHVKNSADGWSLNIQLMISSARDEARFYALQTLQEMLTTHKGRLIPEQSRAQLRSAVLEWIGGNSFDLALQAPYIKNKIAVVMTLMIKLDYPERWPSAFADCKRVLSTHGPAYIDLHLRIFKTIDEEIVEFNAQVPFRLLVCLDCSFLASSCSDTTCQFAMNAPVNRGPKKKLTTTWSSKMQ